MKCQTLSEMADSTNNNITSVSAEPEAGPLEVGADATQPLNRNVNENPNLGQALNIT